MRPTTAIIMAAGLSRRMGCDKLLLAFRGKPILQHVIDLVAGIDFAQRLLVTTPQVLEKVGVPQNIQIILNPNSEDGQSVTVRMGAQAADEGNSLIFFPSDQPLIDGQTINCILSADDGRSILYPVDIDGNPCSPTLFAPRFRKELMRVKGDSGGRQVRLANAEACRGIAVCDPLRLLDIDTREEYERLMHYG